MPPFPNMTFDLDLWPTDLKINRDHLLIKDYLPTKFEASGAKRSWVISCTRLRATDILTDIPTYRPTDIPTDMCNALCPSFFNGGHKDSKRHCVNIHVHLSSPLSWHSGQKNKPCWQQWIKWVAKCKSKLTQCALNLSDVKIFTCMFFFCLHVTTCTCTCINLQNPYILSDSASDVYFTLFYTCKRMSLSNVAKLTSSQRNDVYK